MSDPYLDGLVTSVSRWAAVVQSGDPLRDALLYALVTATRDDRGVVVSRATVPISGTEILYASPRLLALLFYASEAAYAAAVAAGDFVHTADLQVVEDHVRHRNSAAYDARLKKGNGTGYRELRLQGFTFTAGLQGQERDYRVSLFWTP